MLSAATNTRYESKSNYAGMQASNQADRQTDIHIKNMDIRTG